MLTAASSGSISTQYFGEQFDADKVETSLYYVVRVIPSASARNNPNITLHIDVESVSLEDLLGGEDILRVDGTTMIETHRTYNYTPPTGGRNSDSYHISLSRRVIPADVRKQKLNVMPGYRVSWHYSGIEVEPEAEYYNDASTRAFVRHYSNNITFSVSLKFQ